ncbi:MAG: UrcA family protein, partial [Sinobacteraceae bacterium]|nr:UrcA family protein [Nevskiaceae bacterium]
MNGKLLTLVGLSLFCAAAITAKASAPHTLNFQSVTVSYARVDLARPEGVAALYVRIEQAAKTVCHERGVG